MTNLPAAVEEVIRARRTEKVLCEVEEHQEVPPELAATHKQTLLHCLETAGWAPFHYPRNVDGIAEPWRAHLVVGDALKKAANHLANELKLTSKEPKLTAACNALVLVTWLPEGAGSEEATAKQLEVRRARDEEHLAAASAMVQNFLLMLTAHGMGNYWSSGGAYRGAEMFEFLAIPKEEKLLAAVFIEYPEMMTDAKERKPGAWRESRSTNWILKRGVKS